MGQWYILSRAVFRNPKTGIQLQFRVIVISGKRPHLIPYEMVRLTLQLVGLRFPHEGDALQCG